MMRFKAQFSQLEKNLDKCKKNTTETRNLIYQAKIKQFSSS